MRYFYITLPRTLAKDILTGKTHLADVRVPRRCSADRPTKVELLDEIDPPERPDLAVLRVSISRTDEELFPYVVPMVDSNIVLVPRSWLEDAAYGLLSNDQIRRHLKRQKRWKPGRMKSAA